MPESYSSRDTRSNSLLSVIMFALIVQTRILEMDSMRGKGGRGERITDTHYLTIRSPIQGENYNLFEKCMAMVLPHR